jgi:hypothetical protein
VSVDDTGPYPGFSLDILSDASFEQLGERLRELEQWGWLSSDPNTDSDVRQEMFHRIFPGGDTAGPWNDYHSVRSEYDRRAAEEFDLGQ